eukprot:1640919-Alexandrium_andersonii.AAC.1
MRPGPTSEIPDVGAHDELIAALRYCSDTMTQVTQDAVNAGIDEEIDSRASALLKTCLLYTSDAADDM